MEMCAVGSSRSENSNNVCARKPESTRLARSWDCNAVAARIKKLYHIIKEE